MDEFYWNISWSATLMPDLSMIPDSRVFLQASQAYSLTATVAGFPSLLFSSPETIRGILDRALAERSSLLTEDTAKLD